MANLADLIEVLLPEVRNRTLEKMRFEDGAHLDHFDDFGKA